MNNESQIKDCLIEGNLLFYGETKLERDFCLQKRVRGPTRSVSPRESINSPVISLSQNEKKEKKHVNE